MKTDAIENDYNIWNRFRSIMVQCLGWMERWKRMCWPSGWRCLRWKIMRWILAPEVMDVLKIETKRTAYQRNG